MTQMCVFHSLSAISHGTQFVIARCLRGGFLCALRVCQFSCKVYCTFNNKHVPLFILSFTHVTIMDLNFLKCIKQTILFFLYFLLLFVFDQKWTINGLEYPTLFSKVWTLHFIFNLLKKKKKKRVKTKDLKIGETRANNHSNVSVILSPVLIHWFTYHNYKISIKWHLSSGYIALLLHASPDVSLRPPGEARPTLWKPMV